MRDLNQSTTNRTKEKCVYSNHRKCTEQPHGMYMDVIVFGIDNLLYNVAEAIIIQENTDT